MDLYYYQLESRKHAFYPNQGANFMYVALGLTEEVGELWEKAEHPSGAPHLAERKASVLWEAGDVCWYVAAGFTELNMIWEAAGNEVRRDPSFADLHGGEPLIHAAMFHAMKVAGFAKKTWRDHGGFPPAKFHDELVFHLITIGEVVADICMSYGSTLSEALAMNLDKLNSRATRGTLGGSGDNR